jgi:hypothetical protein
MGVYNSIVHNDICLQSKVGDCCMHTYKLGDNLEDHNDGIYVCLEGYYVVFNGKIVAIFDKNSMFNKWNYQMKHPL